MQNRIVDDGLTFDDVLIVPKFSDIEHRSDVDISTQILPQIKLAAPFVSANMDTVTEHRMAHKMSLNGCIGIIHRYMFIPDLIKEIKAYNELCKNDPKNIKHKPLVVSLGVRETERFEEAFNIGVRNFCIDVAHGHHSLVRDSIKSLRDRYADEIGIIAGNVCTYDGAYSLFEWGADCIKVGVGPGSVCTTRIKTGCGFPQLSAILLADKARKDYLSSHNKSDSKFIIADGGIKYYGDVTKAIAAGADAVMMGSMFAGCKETPGPVWRNEKEEMIKTFRGMASVNAQSDFGIEDINEEGVSLSVKYRGSVEHILNRLSKGLRSGLSYSGARNIKKLQEVHEFVKVSQNSVIEGQPHKTIL
jgi:IMP dehydrogenase